MLKETKNNKFSVWSILIASWLIKLEEGFLWGIGACLAVKLLLP